MVLVVSLEKPLIISLASSACAAGRGHACTGAVSPDSEVGAPVALPVRADPQVLRVPVVSAC